MLRICTSYREKRFLALSHGVLLYRMCVLCSPNGLKGSIICHLCYNAVPTDRRPYAPLHRAHYIIVFYFHFFRSLDSPLLVRKNENNTCMENIENGRRICNRSWCDGDAVTQYLTSVNYTSFDSENNDKKYILCWQLIIVLPTEMPTLDFKRRDFFIYKVHDV